MSIKKIRQSHLAGTDKLSLLLHLVPIMPRLGRTGLRSDRRRRRRSSRRGRRSWRSCPSLCLEEREMHVQFEYNAPIAWKINKCTHILQFGEYNMLLLTRLEKVWFIVSLVFKQIQISLAPPCISKTNRSKTSFRSLHEKKNSPSEMWSKKKVHTQSLFFSSSLYFPPNQLHAN